jgi:hypothetical protein
MSHNSDSGFTAGREIKKAASILPAVPGQTENLSFMLTGSQKKTAFALRCNAEAMIKAGGLNSTGFLTLTLGNFDAAGKFHGIHDAREASRRFNNLARRVLNDLFERAIVVTERHKSGAIHFHLLGILAGRPDIRTGFNFERVKKRDYRGVSDTLRGIWAMLRKILPEYGFGRAELTPIKKTGEAVACYVSKYIEKNVCNRLPEDRRKKLVRYIGWNKSQLKPNCFGWASARAAAWRGKTRECAGMIGILEPEKAAETLGARWAWKISGIWQKIDDAVRPFVLWPSFEIRELAKRELYRMANRSAVAMLNLPRLVKLPGTGAEMPAQAIF